MKKRKKKKTYLLLCRMWHDKSLTQIGCMMQHHNGVDCKPKKEMEEAKTSMPSHCHYDSLHLHFASIWFHPFVRLWCPWVRSHHLLLTGSMEWWVYHIFHLNYDMRKSCVVGFSIKWWNFSIMRCDCHSG